MDTAPVEVTPAALLRRQGLRRSGSARAVWWRALNKGWLSRVGLLVILGFVAVAVFAPVLAPPPNPDDPYHMTRDGFRSEPQPPEPGHPLGTTAGQYDIWYGVVWGTRTAFKVGLLVTGLTFAFGTALGAGAAFLGGWVDEIFQRLVEMVMAFPFILAAVTLAAVLMPRMHDRVTVALIALIAFGWTGYARLARAGVLSVSAHDYVLVSRALGASPAWVFRRHIMPNAMSGVLIVASLAVGDAVLAFSALSFLGLGAEPGYADWGQMLGLTADWLPDLARYWYALVFPCGALVLFALAFNLMGDAMRDALDPRLR